MVPLNVFALALAAELSSTSLELYSLMHLLASLSKEIFGLGSKNDLDHMQQIFLVSLASLEIFGLGSKNDFDHMQLDESKEW